jgi:MFS family permease
VGPEVVPASRIPFVRVFVLGRTFAVLGATIVSTAVGWQLYERTGSVWSLGLVGLVQFVPVLAFFVAVGHAVDRYPRRRIAALAHVAYVLASLGLAWTAWSDGPTAAIYALLFVVGTARAFSAPATRTILPQILAPVQFAHANALLSASFEFASAAGPAVAGLLIAASGGTTLPYLVAAVGQVAFLVALAFVPARPPHSRQGPTAAEGLLEGLRFVRRTPVLLSAVMLDLFGVLFGGAVALLPVYAKDVLHVGPSGLGWLRSAPALGAFLMAVLATRLPAWRRPGRVLLATVAGFGLATIGFGLSRSFALSLACLFLTGVFDSVSVVIRLTLEQMVTPDRLRGRVAAVNFVFIGLSNEIGAAESSAVAALLGPVASVVGGGVATLVVVAAVARAWPVLLRLGPLESLHPGAAPDAPRPP